jgi:hypothetical protein
MTPATAPGLGWPLAPDLVSPAGLGWPGESTEPPTAPPHDEPHDPHGTKEQG